MKGSLEETLTTVLENEQWRNGCLLFVTMLLNNRVKVKAAVIHVETCTRAKAKMRKICEMTKIDARLV